MEGIDELGHKYMLRSNYHSNAGMRRDCRTEAYLGAELQDPHSEQHPVIQSFLSNAGSLDTPGYLEGFFWVVCSERA